MTVTTTYEMTVEVWRSDEPGDRYFVTLPDDVAEDVRAKCGGSYQAIGSLPVSAALGQSIWSTSLHTDAGSGSYVLPIRPDVRRRERVRDGQTVTVRLALKR